MSHTRDHTRAVQQQRSKVVSGMEVRAERSEKGFMRCLDYSKRARGFSKRAKELELPEVIKWLKGSCFGVLLASNSWTLGSDVMIATNITLLLGNSMQFLSFEGSDLCGVCRAYGTVA
jgi:hypothetical protein